MIELIAVNHQQFLARFCDVNAFIDKFDLRQAKVRRHVEHQIANERIVIAGGVDDASSVFPQLCQSAEDTVIDVWPVPVLLEFPSIDNYRPPDKAILAESDSETAEIRRRRSDDSRGEYRSRKPISADWGRDRPVREQGSAPQSRLPTLTALRLIEREISQRLIQPLET